MEGDECFRIFIILSKCLKNLEKLNLESNKDENENRLCNKLEYIINSG